MQKDKEMNPQDSAIADAKRWKMTAIVLGVLFIVAAIALAMMVYQNSASEDEEEESSEPQAGTATARLKKVA